MRVQFALVSALAVTSIQNNRARAADDAPERWECTPVDTANPADGAACLGVVLNDVSEETAQRLGLAEKRGALVVAVIEGTPAYVAGLREGDVILLLGDYSVDSMQTLISSMGEFAPGDQVTMTVWRDGEAVPVGAVLGVDGR